jgi:hypothetical protein
VLTQKPFKNKLNTLNSCVSINSDALNHKFAVNILSGVAHLTSGKVLNNLNFVVKI